MDEFVIIQIELGVVENDCPAFIVLAGHDKWLVAVFYWGCV
ncbi:hypothetical protein [Craterilacuibacter sp. RT1T]|nr:hypothetical protein [Craterilacuibacter sp. RT1T]